MNADDRPLHQQADMLRLAGDLAHARSLVQDGLGKSSGESRGQLLAVLGLINLDAGENAAATIALEEAVSLCSGDAQRTGDLLLELGRARRRCGNLDGALESLQKAASHFIEADLSSGRRKALGAQGRVHYGRREWVKAREVFAEALQQGGDEPATWKLEHALARTHEREGEHAQAESHYKLARAAGWDGFSGGRADLDLPAYVVGVTASAGDSLVDHDEEAELARAVKDLGPDDLVRLVTLGGALNTTLAPEPMLELLLDRALAWTVAERGYVVVCRPRRGGGAPKVEVRFALDRAGEKTASPEDELSRAVVGRVTQGGEAFFSADASADERLREVSAAAQGGARSVACVPLVVRSGLALGALYLEVREETGAFDDARSLLSALARQVAVAYERSSRYQRLADAYNETRRALEEANGNMFGLVSNARSMRQVLRMAEKLRDHDAPILIEGEAGTGKELIARAIHRHSRRRQAPFVVETCGSLPDGLVEAELFGHERGAFTGAVEARRGAFERAEGGTLFLDEVSQMSMRMQSLVLRVLTSGELRPLGSPAPRGIDCRVVCASHEPLEELVRKGRFSEDLYLRLNVVKLEVPPLRQRREDLPALVDSFLKDKGRTSSDLSPQALEAILNHDWPGNSRELRHVLERASTLAGSGQISPRHLGLDGLRSSSGARRLGRSSSGSQSAAKVEWHGYVLNRRQVALLEYLKNSGVATNREYVQLVNVSVPTGWRDLKDMLDKGLIRAEGQGRNTVYRLSDSAPIQASGDKGKS